MRPQFNDYIECSLALGSSLFRPVFHYTANGLAIENCGPKTKDPFFSDRTGAVRFYIILSGMVCKGINTL